MPSDINPYAAPPLIAEVIHQSPLGGQDGGVWRDGKQLVILKGTPLPPRCVKSNQPTDKSLKRNLIWYPQWIAFTVLIAWPVFLVLALVLQKKATVHIGLTEEWLARRRFRIGIVWCLALLGIGLFVGAFPLIEEYEEVGVAMILSSLVVLIGSLIYGTTAARLITPAKIDDRFVWLKGVCPEYLAELPPWPGTR
jgi:hypothetical protein